MLLLLSSEQTTRVSYASKEMKNAKQSRCVIDIKGQAPDPITGRAVSNVSRTMKTWDGLGIVRLVTSEYVNAKK
ncbi:hypothetical protein [Agarivorans sp. Alg241-V36]|uniref:hypothetical protein n=1 Tax=Agarivorans sp. Alg241-V36 TaxID=2305992 RepID=UPI0013D80F55|nr:hypothetical protein [Agarivorans sp. Alg241-V36]